MRVDLRTILDKVIACPAAEWHSVLAMGAPPGGTVGFVLSGPSSQSMTVTDVAGHHGAAVMIDSPEISIAWGLQVDEGLVFAFLDRMEDSLPVASFLVDVMLNGVVVHRELYIYVDGGRACLPMPRAMLSSMDIVDDAVVIAEQITEWEDSLAALVNELSGRREYERYRDQAGFVVVPGHHPLDDD